MPDHSGAEKKVNFLGTNTLLCFCDSEITKWLKFKKENSKKKKEEKKEEKKERKRKVRKKGKKGNEVKE